MSPTPMPMDAMSSSSSGNSLLTAWKPGSAPVTKNSVGGPYGLVEKIQPLALTSPEEQTDNWDDDFEEGISLSKLQGEHLLGRMFQKITPLTKRKSYLQPLIKRKRLRD